MATRSTPQFDFQGLLKSVSDELSRLEELYTSGADAASDEAKAVRASFHEKIGSDNKQGWGAFIGWLMEPVVIAGPSGAYDFEPGLLKLALGPDTDYVGLAEALRSAQKATGVTLQKFNRQESRKLLEALRKQGGAATVTVTGSKLVGRITGRVQIGGAEATIARWVSEKERKKTEDAVRKGLGGQGRAETKVETKPDPEAELKAKIADAEKRLASAKEAEDFDTAKTVKAELGQFREELTKLTAPRRVVVAGTLKPAKKGGKTAATATPAPTAEPAPVGSGNGQAEDPVQRLVKVCEVAPEGSAAKILLGRFIGDELTAEAFMAKAERLGLLR